MSIRREGGLVGKQKQMKYPNVLTGAIVGVGIFLSTIVGVSIVAVKFAPAPKVERQTEYITSGDFMVVSQDGFITAMNKLMSCEHDNKAWSAKYNMAHLPKNTCPLEPTHPFTEELQ